MNWDEKVATSPAFSSVCFFCPSQKPRRLYQRTKTSGNVKQACSSSCIKSNSSNKLPTDRSTGTPGYFHGEEGWLLTNIRQLSGHWRVRYLFPFAHCTVVKEQCATASTEHCALQKYNYPGEWALTTVHPQHKRQFVLTVQMQGQGLPPPLQQEAEYEIHRCLNFFLQQMDNPDRCWLNASGLQKCSTPA